MKLFELLDPDAWDKEGLDAPYLKREGPKSVVKAAERLRAEEPDHKYVDSGSYAYVSRRDTPHDMDHVIRLSPKKDASAMYLKAVYEAGLHNNPFLPRLLARPKTSGNVQTAQIERLVPFRTPKIMDNRELMLSLWEQWFTNRPTERIQNNIDSELEQWTHEFSEETSGFMNDYISRGSNKYIKDQDLKDALDFIVALRKKHQLLEDLHPGNLMWRITGNMPQLVITDPLQTFLSLDEM